MDGLGFLSVSGDEIDERSPSERGGRWYAVQTYPHREEAVERHLSYQGFATYLPRSLRTVRHARRTATKRVAYFDRYLFVSVDVDRQRWRCINGTLGVKNLIMCGQKPLPVPIGIVETLVSATDEAGILRSTSLLKPGSRVRVIAGSLMDQLGVLDSLDGRGAASVLIAIMGRQVSVRISRDQIVPLS